MSRRICSLVVCLLFTLLSLPKNSHSEETSHQAFSPHKQLSCSSKESEFPVVVFDVTGAVNGFGDIVGVLNIMDGIREEQKNLDIYIVTDAKSKNDLETYYAMNAAELKSNHGVQMVDLMSSDTIPCADYIFETFVGGRIIPDYRSQSKTPESISSPYEVASTTSDISDQFKPIESFEQLPFFCEGKTVLVITDTMHGSGFSEIRYPTHSIFLKPPGIGPHRSGVFSLARESKELLSIDDKKDQIELAKTYFDPEKKPEHQGIQNLLDLGDFKLGFFYGVHNEVFNGGSDIVGQTVDYLNAIKDTQKPSLLFTPNSSAHLLQAGVEKKIIHTLHKDGQHLENLENGQLIKIDDLEKKVYVICTGKVDGKQFNVLMALSDWPVFIEGNNSLSQVIRMQKPFMVYTSQWNQPQIMDLVKLEDYWLQSHFFKDVYLNTDVSSYFPTPFAVMHRWYRWFRSTGVLMDNSLDYLDPFASIHRRPNHNLFFEDSRPTSGAFQPKLNIRIPIFPKGLVKKINIADRFQNMLEQDSVHNPENSLQALLKEAAATGDEIFRYSLAFTAHELGKMETVRFESLKERYPYAANWEEGFKPIQPRQSF